MFIIKFKPILPKTFMLCIVNCDFILEINIQQPIDIGTNIVKLKQDEC